ncbi:cupin domain-containing protein [Fibrella sp. HMF5335]|uniref:Cupin domain-containing protein n=1 Tax=Fibrella rubiginis TaxID=2817060 RepID=A0A939GEV8_9BACT|nr:cupin domain-containing protein [Fibrella rubiginis]MBO0935436.1 cupin domain-containing protein [Fibrella rubiginis]
MQRRMFMLNTLAAVPLMASNPDVSPADREKKGFKVAAGEGRYHGPIHLQGVNANVLAVKVSGKDTNGDLAIFEQTSLSPGRGTPMHVHPYQDEVFTVIDGEYAFQIGDDKYRLKSGETIFLPRQVPHSWIQLSERGKMMVTMQPAGKLEDFFVAVAALKTPPTPAELAAIFAQNDMKVVGPPMTVD